MVASTSQDDNSPTNVTTRGHCSQLYERKTIADLPNELLIRIFHHLHAPPASSAQDALYLEPRLDMTVNAVAPLKTVSLVSALWREAALPILFKHAQLVAPRAETSPGAVAAYFDDFLTFFTDNKLQKAVLSITLICSNKDFSLSTYSLKSIKHFTKLWGNIFSVLDPDDVLVIASVEALGFLTACSVNLDARDFFDAPYQYLKLSRPSRARGEVGSDAIVGTSHESEKYDNGPSLTGQQKPMELWPRAEEEKKSATGGFGDLHIEPVKISAPDDIEAQSNLEFADASELFRRPWTKLLLNEGSLLKIFARPDFWEFETPSVSHSSSYVYQYLTDPDSKRPTHSNTSTARPDQPYDPQHGIHRSVPPRKSLLDHNAIFPAS